MTDTQFCQRQYDVAVIAANPYKPERRPRCPPVFTVVTASSCSTVCVCVCVCVKHHTNKAKTHKHRNQGEPRLLLKHAERAVLKSLKNSEKYKTMDTWTLHPTTLNPGTWLQRFLQISHYRGQCSFHRCQGNNKCSHHFLKA